jgi:hypothetical protein
MVFWKQVLGTFIGGLGVWLITAHSEFIASWVTNRIWQIAIVIAGCAIGCVIGWKISYILRLIRCACEWVKNIWTISKTKDEINKLKDELKSLEELKGRVSVLEKKAVEMEEKIKAEATKASMAIEEFRALRDAVNEMKQAEKQKMKELENKPSSSTDPLSMSATMDKICRPQPEIVLTAEDVKKQILAGKRG